MDATAESTFHPNRFLRDLPALSMQYELVARCVAEWASRLSPHERQRLPPRLENFIPDLRPGSPSVREACVLGFVRDTVLGRELSCDRADIAALHGEYIFRLLQAYDRYVEAGCKMYRYPPGWVESVRNRKIDPSRFGAAMRKKRIVGSAGYVHLGLSSGTMVGQKHYLDGLYFHLGHPAKLNRPASEIAQLLVTIVCRSLLGDEIDEDTFEPKFSRTLCAPCLHVVFDLSRHDPGHVAYATAQSAPITRDEEFQASWSPETLAASTQLALGAISGLFRNET